MFIKSSVHVNVSRDAARLKRESNASLLILNFNRNLDDSEITNITFDVESCGCETINLQDSIFDRIVALLLQKKRRKGEKK